MNIWHDLDIKRISPEEFIVCIEISKNSKMKYELDKETGRLILDRVLFTSTHYPANYGFIPKTYAGDNDPLDVLVLCQSEIIPLCLVKCRPIGVIKMIDNDQVDEKVIAVPVGDPSWNSYKNIDELPEHILDEMRHFFGVYKQLEGKTTSIVETRGPIETKRIIAQAIERYQETFKK
jgi:inorganic pyrophosphatase